MLNLAALRYRAVLAARGGPVARLELAESPFGRRREFLANATLRPGLADGQPVGALYADAHGTGVSPSPMVARFIAISEALERWAHWQVHAGGDAARFGFDVDPSSNGMAAFPGLFARQARAAAELEAAERFNLLHWWEGGLAASEGPTDWPGVRAATICSEAPGVTVITYAPTPAGLMAYGHAAAPTFAAACRRAASEMERHAQVLERFARSPAGRVGVAEIPAEHRFERRSVFFATAEGHERFLERLRSGRRRALAVPRKIYDGAIPGPWSRYADVWRVAFAPPSHRFLGDDDGYFFW